MSKIFWFMGRPDAQGPHTQTMLDSLEVSAGKISKLPEALRESGKNSGRTGKESLLLSLCSWHVDPSHCIGVSLGSLCCFLSSLPNGSGSDGVQRFFYIFNVFSFAGSSLGWDISFSLSNWMLALLAYCKKLYLFTSSRHLEKGPSGCQRYFHSFLAFVIQPGPCSLSAGTHSPTGEGNTEPQGWNLSALKKLGKHTNNIYQSSSTLQTLMVAVSSLCKF